MKSIKLIIFLALVLGFLKTVDAAVFIVNPDYQVRPLETDINVRSEVTLNTNQVRFRTIKMANYSGIEVKNNVVVKTDESWQKLWAEAHSNQTPVPAAPEIDFTKKMVIGVFLGEKPTGGFGVQIKRILRPNNKSISVYFTEMRPGKSCVVTQAVTSPYHLVEVDKFDGQVNFHPKVSIFNCK